MRLKTNLCIIVGLGRALIGSRARGSVAAVAAFRQCRRVTVLGLAVRRTLSRFTEVVTVVTL